MVSNYITFLNKFLLYRYKALVVVAIFLSLLSALFASLGMGLFLPVISNFMKEKSVDNSFFNISEKALIFLGFNTADLLPLIMTATLTIAFGALITYLTMILSGYLCLFTYKSIKDIVINDILNRPYEYFTKEKVGNIVSIITEQANLASYTVEIMFRLLTHLFLLVCLTLSMLIVSSNLTLYFIAFGLFVIISQRWIFKKTRYFFDAWNKIRLNHAAFFAETIIGIKTIKLMGLEKYRYNQAVSLINDESKTILKTHIIHHLSPFYSLVVSISFVSAGLYLGIEILKIPASIILLSLAIFMRINQSLQGANQAWLDLNKSYPNISIIMDISTFNNNIEFGEDNFSFEKDISINEISFKYGSKLIINNLSLDIPKNSFIALVGPSGGGKTTLIDLIIGLYAPGKGKILYDGKLLSQYKHENWCKSIGFVSQDIFLFHDTITNNIAFGDSTPDMDRINWSANTAHANQFIHECQNGYETLLGDRGVKLSGGQRQRIALARALYHNPPIIILDEATSALDSESEQQIQLALEKIRGGITIIAVAHRLSTIRKADMIVYIEDGEIKEQGTHEQLMDSGSYYKKLQLQQTT